MKLRNKSVTRRKKYLTLFFDNYFDNYILIFYTNIENQMRFLFILLFLRKCGDFATC